MDLENSNVLVQGITGSMGKKIAKEMLASGTKVIAGVTPGKGGQSVEQIPVFDAVAEAMHLDPDTSVIVVPPLLVRDAALEALDAGIPRLLIVTENVPIKDAAYIREYALQEGATILGPSSVGMIQPGVAKLGPIAGGEESRMYSRGNVAVLSKSGGMCAETSRLLTAAGIGQRIVIGIGGDVIAGATFADILPTLEDDPEVKAIVLVGEIGGAYEEEAAKVIATMTTPVVAFVMGTFAESIQGLALGHAGAIVENGSGSAETKRIVLQKAGATIAKYHDDIPQLVKKVL